MEFCHCICYLVFHMFFYKNQKGCYSNGFKFLIMMSNTILQPRLHTLLTEYHYTFKKWCTTRPACTYLHAGTGPCTSFYSGSFAEEVAQNINYHKPSCLL